MAEETTIISKFKSQLVAEIATAVAGLLLTVLLARLLGSDGYGVLYTAISVFTVLMVVSKLGIGRSAGRFISEYKTEDPTQIRSIVKSSFGFNLISLAVAVGVLLVTHRHVASLIGEPRLVPLLRVGAFYVLFGTLMLYARLILQGFDAISSSALVLALDRVLRLLLALSLVFMGFGVMGALFGYVAAYGLSAFVGLVLVFGYQYRRYEPTQSLEDGLRRRIVEYSIPITLSTSADMIDRRVDILFTAFFLNPVAVSQYVIGKQMVTFLDRPIKALGFTISPSFGEDYAAGNVERPRRIYQSSLVNALAIYVPAGAGVAVVAPPMLDIVFGQEYLGAAPVLQIFSVYVIFVAITRLSSNVIDYLGEAKLKAYAKGGSALLNVGLNVVLIPTLGVAGAALATVLSYSLYTAANLYLIHRLLTLDLSRLVRDVSRIIAVTVVMSGSLILSRPYVVGVENDVFDYLAFSFAVQENSLLFFALEYVAGLLSLSLLVLLGVAVYGVLALNFSVIDPRAIVDRVSS